MIVALFILQGLLNLYHRNQKVSSTRDNKKPKKFEHSSIQEDNAIDSEFPPFANSRTSSTSIGSTASHQNHPKYLPNSVAVLPSLDGAKWPVNKTYSNSSIIPNSPNHIGSLQNSEAFGFNAQDELYNGRHIADSNSVSSTSLHDTNMSESSKNNKKHGAHHSVRNSNSSIEDSHHSNNKVSFF